MTLLNNMVPQGDSSFYTSKYRQMIEDHIIFLRNHKSNSVVPIAPMVSFKYAADFYGLLFHLKVPMEYHYAILRINGLRNPSDFRGTEESIVVCDTEVVKRLLNTLKTQIKKNTK